MPATSRTCLGARATGTMLNGSRSFMPWACCGPPFARMPRSARCALVRYRAELIQRRAPHVQHMQQALKVMNLQLSEMLTDVVGTTGLAILRAIAAGERDPLVLAQHRAVCCRASSEMIAKALTGTWKDEQIFVLQQALTLYDAYPSHISACDATIEALLTAMEARAVPARPVPA